MFDGDSEGEILSRFVLELVIWPKQVTLVLASLKLNSTHGSAVLEAMFCSSQPSMVHCISWVTLSFLVCLFVVRPALVTFDPISTFFSHYKQALKLCSHPVALNTKQYQVIRTRTTKYQPAPPILTHHHATKYYPVLIRWNTLRRRIFSWGMNQKRGWLRSVYYTMLC